MRLILPRTARAVAVAFTILSAGVSAMAQPAASPSPDAPPRATGVMATASRTRIAIREFTLDGDDTSTALAMQLQDGFVLGLSRAGIAVLDSADVGRQLQAVPELEKCETSLCLRRIGQVLQVQHLLRVRVSVTSNSYRMTARLFSTETTTPAVVPMDTQSRFCEVCTVTEARDMMIRLADAIKRPFESAAKAVAAVATATPPAPSRGARAAVAGGVLAVLAGAAVLLVDDSGGKGLPALGGGLIGAGLVLGSAGVTFLVNAGASGPGSPAPGVAAALRLRF